MMRRRRFMILILLLVGGWMFGSSPLPAHACSCADLPPPDIAIRQSAAVFAGEVLSIKVKRPNPFGGRNPDYPIEVTFRVTDTWKGVGTDRFMVRTSMSTCGFDFDEGKSYIVYAYETREGLATGLCTRTVGLALAGDDLAALGEGTVPPPSPEPEGRGMRRFQTGVAIAVFPAVVFAMLLLWLRRHGKRKRGMT